MKNFTFVLNTAFSKLIKFNIDSDYNDQGPYIKNATGIWGNVEYYRLVSQKTLKTYHFNNPKVSVQAFKNNLYFPFLKELNIDLTDIHEALIEANSRCFFLKNKQGEYLNELFLYKLQQVVEVIFNKISTGVSLVDSSLEDIIDLPLTNAYKMEESAAEQFNSFFNNFGLFQVRNVTQYMQMIVSMDNLAKEFELPQSRMRYQFLKITTPRKEIRRPGGIITEQDNLAIYYRDQAYHIFDPDYGMISGLSYQELRSILIQLELTRSVFLIERIEFSSGPHAKRKLERFLQPITRARDMITESRRVDVIIYGHKISKRILDTMGAFIVEQGSDRERTIGQWLLTKPHNNTLREYEKIFLDAGEYAATVNLLFNVQPSNLADIIQGTQNLLFKRGEGNEEKKKYSIAKKIQAQATAFIQMRKKQTTDLTDLNPDDFNIKSQAHSIASFKISQLSLLTKQLSLSILDIKDIANLYLMNSHKRLRVNRFNKLSKAKSTSLGRLRNAPDMISATFSGDKVSMAVNIGHMVFGPKLERFLGNSMSTSATVKRAAANSILNFLNIKDLLTNSYQLHKLGYNRSDPQVHDLLVRIAFNIIDSLPYILSTFAPYINPALYLQLMRCTVIGATVSLIVQVIYNASKLVEEYAHKYPLTEAEKVHLFLDQALSLGMAEVSSHIKRIVDTTITSRYYYDEMKTIEKIFGSSTIYVRYVEKKRAKNDGRSYSDRVVQEYQSLEIVKCEYIQRDPCTGFQLIFNSIISLARSVRPTQEFVVIKPEIALIDLTRVSPDAGRRLSRFSIQPPENITFYAAPTLDSTDKGECSGPNSVFGPQQDTKYHAYNMVMISDTSLKTVRPKDITIIYNLQNVTVGRIKAATETTNILDNEQNAKYYKYTNVFFISEVKTMQEGVITKAEVRNPCGVWATTILEGFRSEHQGPVDLEELSKHTLGAALVSKLRHDAHNTWEVVKGLEIEGGGNNTANYFMFSSIKFVGKIVLHEHAINTLDFNNVQDDILQIAISEHKIIITPYINENVPNLPSFIDKVNAINYIIGRAHFTEKFICQHSDTPIIINGQGTNLTNIDTIHNCPHIMMHPDTLIIIDQENVNYNIYLDQIQYRGNSTVDNNIINGTINIFFKNHLMNSQEAFDNQVSMRYLESENSLSMILTQPRTQEQFTLKLNNYNESSVYNIINPHNEIIDFILQEEITDLIYSKRNTTYDDQEWYIKSPSSIKYNYHYHDENSINYLGSWYQNHEITFGPRMDCARGGGSNDTYIIADYSRDKITIDNCYIDENYPLPALQYNADLISIDTSNKIRIESSSDDLVLKYNHNNITLPPKAITLKNYFRCIMINEYLTSDLGIKEQKKIIIGDKNGYYFTFKDPLDPQELIYYGSKDNFGKITLNHDYILNYAQLNANSVDVLYYKVDHDLLIAFNSIVQDYYSEKDAGKLTVLEDFFRVPSAWYNFIIYYTQDNKVLTGEMLLNIATAAINDKNFRESWERLNYKDYHINTTDTRHVMIDCNDRLLSDSRTDIYGTYGRLVFDLDQVTPNDLKISFNENQDIVLSTPNNYITNITIKNWQNQSISPLHTIEFRNNKYHSKLRSFYSFNLGKSNDVSKLKENFAFIKFSYVLDQEDLLLPLYCQKYLKSMQDIWDIIKTNLSAKEKYKNINDNVNIAELEQKIGDHYLCVAKKLFIQEMQKINELYLIAIARENYESYEASLRLGKDYYTPHIAPLVDFVNNSFSSYLNDPITMPTDSDLEKTLWDWIDPIFGNIGALKESLQPPASRVSQQTFEIISIESIYYLEEVASSGARPSSIINNVIGWFKNSMNEISTSVYNKILNKSSIEQNYNISVPYQLGNNKKAEGNKYKTIDPSLLDTISSKSFKELSTIDNFQNLYIILDSLSGSTSSLLIKKFLINPIKNIFSIFTNPSMASPHKGNYNYQKPNDALDKIMLNLMRGQEKYNDQDNELVSSLVGEII
ncbi:hypothetical protein [Rickettsia endosymbiont of Halotydeus destructor]|uniref:hypothetical protein n=1 Tax=Rickettsia endosymbiont of Halotydeus destructor TaxID=2996754 RepID=UPI003BB04CDA